MKAAMKRFIDKIAPAFDEALIYPVALAGTLCSPIVAAASLGEDVILRWPTLGDMAIALVITMSVLFIVMLTELRGTSDQKRIPRVRALRYFFAFFGAMAWRQVVPALVTLLLRGIEALGHLLGIGS
jgi:hypothetical protein